MERKGSLLLSRKEASVTNNEIFEDYLIDKKDDVNYFYHCFCYIRETISMKRLDLWNDRKIELKERSLKRLGSAMYYNPHVSMNSFLYMSSC